MSNKTNFDLVSGLRGYPVLSRKRAYTLTDHELRLMNVLWEQGEGTVGDVVAALEPPRLAYSTVLTTMRTLEHKEYVLHDKSGRAFVYRPLVQRAEAATSLLYALLDRFHASSPIALVMSLLEDPRLSKRDFARLKQLIERKGAAK